MNIQWYPGHMTKAKRNIANDVKLVDIVIEILDARAPLSTENPDIRKITSGKKRLIILNKSDLADRNATSAWISYFRKQGASVIAMDSRTRNCLGLVKKAIEELTADKRERDQKKGIIGERAVKALVCGIPNVGKSTFINSIAGKASAKTGDKPGVTKGNQWLTIGNLLLLDTPGVLWPKFDDETTGLHLAMIGAINDNIINTEELALELISFLNKEYKAALMDRYGLDDETVNAELAGLDGTLMVKDNTALAELNLIAVRRGAVRKGAQPDYEKTARFVLDDFRSGKFGEVSLERPGSVNE